MQFQNIGLYISALLVDNDCVIVPGFGGFVASLSGSKHDPIRHIFYPPFKEITFNRKLTKNDGLLVNFFAEQNGISFESANQHIEKEVNSYLKKLNNQDKVSFDEIGILRKTNDRILFEPDLNYSHLKSSFGLESIQILPVIKSIVSEIKPKVSSSIEVEEKVTKPIVEFENRPSISSELKQRRLRRVVYSAALLPLLAYFFWIPFKSEVFKGNFHYSELNPFTNKICDTYNPRTSLVKKMEYLLPSYKRDFGNHTKNLFKLNLYEPDDVEYVKGKYLYFKFSESKTKPYHIIAGCFSEKANAIQLVDYYQKKGYNASIALFKKNLHYVSVQNYSSRNDAEAAVENLKVSFQKNYWLLKN